MTTTARRILSTTMVSLATMYSGVAQAAWPISPNVNVPLCTAAGDQRVPAIVADMVGGAIVTWQDNRRVIGDIYARRVDQSGTPLWTANGVAVCTADNEQISPSITSDGAGGAIIVWRDVRDGTARTFAQRLNAEGVPQWTPDGVALNGVSGQSDPVVMADGAGGAFIAWSEYRYDGGPTSPRSHILAQRINSAGVLQWGLEPVTEGPVGQFYPAMASDGADGVIVTWLDQVNSQGTYYIYAQRLNGAGIRQWAHDGIYY